MKKLLFSAALIFGLLSIVSCDKTDKPDYPKQLTITPNTLTMWPGTTYRVQWFTYNISDPEKLVWTSDNSNVIEFVNTSAFNNCRFICKETSGKAHVIATLPEANLTASVTINMVPTPSLEPDVKVSGSNVQMHFTLKNETGMTVKEAKLSFDNTDYNIEVKDNAMSKTFDNVAAGTHDYIVKVYFNEYNPGEFPGYDHAAVKCNGTVTIDK